MKTKAILLYGLAFVLLVGLCVSLAPIQIGAQPAAKVYREAGGDEIVIQSGGAITIQSGGAITAETGGAITADDLTVSDDLTVTGDLTVGGSTLTDKYILALGAHTGTRTLSATESGAVVWEATTSTCALTLPAAAAGLHYKVGVYNSGTLTVDAGTGDQILNLTNATGDKISNSGNVGDFVELVAIDATYWFVEDSSGTWSDAN